MRSERFASASLKDFSERKELYRSGAGAVYRARFKYDGCLYVLKERKVSEMGKKKDIMNEVRLLTQLDHANVIKCEGWFNDEEKGSLFIILEYCNCGDLTKKIASRKLTGKPKFFPERYIWFIFHQMCLGVQHLHYNGIVHRDLKTLNIMLTRKDCQIKLADLGVSRQISNNTAMLQTVIGTPLYLSPELVDNLPYNEKTDIWSLGIILYELCALRVPFQARNVLGLAELIRKGVYEPISNEYSKALDRCIAWLLTIEHARRPSINQLVCFVESKLTPMYKGEDIAAEHVAALSPEDINPQDADTESDEEVVQEEKVTEKRGGKSPIQMQRVGGSPNRDSAEKEMSPVRRERKSDDNEASLPSVHRNKGSPSIQPPVVPLVVRIDVARLQAALRKELLKVRRLRKLKQFFSCSDQTGEESKGNNDHSDLHEKLSECCINADTLEKAISNDGEMLRADVERFDTLRPAVAEVKKVDTNSDVNPCAPSAPTAVEVGSSSKWGASESRVKSSKEDYEPVGALQRISNMKYNPFEVQPKDIFKQKKLDYNLFNHGIPEEIPRPSTTGTGGPGRSRRTAEEPRRSKAAAAGPAPPPAKSKDMVHGTSPRRNILGIEQCNASMQESNRQVRPSAPPTDNRRSRLPSPVAALSSHHTLLNRSEAEAAAKGEKDTKTVQETKCESKCSASDSPVETQVTADDEAEAIADKAEGTKPESKQVSSSAGKSRSRQEQSLNIFSDSEASVHVKRPVSRLKQRTGYNIITGEADA